MMDTLELITNNEYKYLSMIVRQPRYLETTIIKEEYLCSKNKTMLKILKEDFKTNKELLPENLVKYKGFDLNYYIELLDYEFVYANLDNMFKELEKSIIETYKIQQAKKITEEEKTFKNIAKKISKLDEIQEFENDFIKANEIFNELTIKNTKIQFNYPRLDYELNLSQGDLLVIAGGTGTGKTAFALNLLDRLSKDYQCVYFNMEMSKNILYRRLLAIKTQMTLMELNDISNLKTEEKKKIKENMFEIENNKIILINKAITTEDIKEHITNIKTEKHMVVFIDHIGLIKSSGGSLYERMTNIAKELRNISLNCDCTIIGLCQLSRESQKNDSVPKLQDLRDSGEIEQSARKVIILHNKDPKNINREHEMELIIAKNDDGKQNVIKEFTFDRYTQTFSEKYV